MASSFRARSVFAITNLAELEEEVSKYSNLATLRLDIEDAIGRFSVWAMNIGAIQHATLLKSLDERLRDTPEIREQLFSAFEKLSEAAGIALRIVRTELRNRRDDEYNSWEQSADGEGPEMNLRNELKELFHSIKSSIDTLFRLAMLLRRHRPNGGHPHSSSDADGGPPPLDPTDMTSICDLFPSVREKPWLLKRLAEAMSRRRGYIKYREKHRWTLAVVEDIEQIGNGDEPKTIGTTATAFTDLEQTGSHPRSEVRTTLISPTSFPSNISDDENGGPEAAIPDLRQMRMYGRGLRYDEPFECPLCRTIQSIAERQEWEAHVFADLEPYVCTFKDCQLSSSPFSSRNQWWQHEVNNHRRSWQCTLCTDTLPASETASAMFISKQGIESHIAHRHSDTVTDAQVEFVARMCESPLDTDSSTCPFCEDWAAGGKGEEGHTARTNSLGTHMARHMERLAFASIPNHTDGLEVADAPSYTDLGQGVSVGGDFQQGPFLDEMARFSFRDATRAGLAAWREISAGLETEGGTKIDSSKGEGGGNNQPAADNAKPRGHFTREHQEGRHRHQHRVEDLVSLAVSSWEQANRPMDERGGGSK